MVKKFILISLCVGILLASSGCSSDPKQNESSNSPNTEQSVSSAGSNTTEPSCVEEEIELPDTSVEYAFPGLPWGSTPQEVLDACGVKKEDLSKEDCTVGSSGEGDLHIPGVVVFGEKSDAVVFEFTSLYKKGYLYYAEIYYPDDADMDTVRAEMKKAYGEPVDRFTDYWLSGDQEECITDNENKCWASKKTLGSVLNQELQEVLRRIQYEPLDNDITDEEWENYLKNHLATVYLDTWGIRNTDPIRGDEKGPHPYKNYVEISGLGMMDTEVYLPIALAERDRLSKQ